MNNSMYQRVTLRDGAPFVGVLQAQSTLPVPALQRHREYAIATAMAKSACYGDFDALTERYAALQASPGRNMTRRESEYDIAVRLDASGVPLGEHLALAVAEALKAPPPKVVEVVEPPPVVAPAAVEAIEPPSHAVQLDDRRLAAQKPLGCHGLARLRNVAASSNMAPALPLCRVNDHPSRSTTVTGAERFALVAKLQTVAIAAASVRRPVRSL